MGMKRAAWCLQSASFSSLSYHKSQDRTAQLHKAPTQKPPLPGRSTFSQILEGGSPGAPPAATPFQRQHVYTGLSERHKGSIRSLSVWLLPRAPARFPGNPPDKLRQPSRPRPSPVSLHDVRTETPRISPLSSDASLYLVGEPLLSRPFPSPTARETKPQK